MLNKVVVRVAALCKCKREGSKRAERLRTRAPFRNYAFVCYFVIVTFSNAEPRLSSSLLAPRLGAEPQCRGLALSLFSKMLPINFVLTSFAHAMNRTSLWPFHGVCTGFDTVVICTFSALLDIWKLVKYQSSFKRVFA